MFFKIRYALLKQSISLGSNILIPLFNFISPFPDCKVTAMLKFYQYKNCELNKKNNNFYKNNNNKTNKYNNNNNTKMFMIIVYDTVDYYDSNNY